MNIEFLILILDYFKTLRRRDFLLEVALPIILSAILFYLNYSDSDLKTDVESQSAILISLLGILIGFSIAVITLLITSATKNIDEIKLKLTKYSTANRPITLFDLLLITYTYSVVCEILLVILNLFIPPLIKGMCSPISINLLNTVNLVGVMHVLFVTIRNVTNFYFILIKK